ncbi:hypothetical protein D4764_16G0003080 [Takifugu flavidus]|uniref:Uncharacterized protein n=1 Tax=Takifugu flavidus TaxID=433684 RepID=A0A5C6NYW1_9TELE|nr:hypothetical protein D4764_16G0003080 [Takifugu flavidus]
MSSLRGPGGSEESGCEATALEHQLISDASGAKQPSTIIREQESKQKGCYCKENDSAEAQEHASRSLSSDYCWRISR